LNVLRCKKEDIQKAKTLLKKNVVNIKIEKRSDLFLAVELITDRGSARAVIRDTHDNIVLIQKDKQTVYKGKRKRAQSTVSPIDDYRIIDLLNFTKDIPFRDISFISDAMSMNRDLMEEGLKGNWGLRAGEKLYHLMNKGDIANDLMNSVAAAVACAIDARVGGAPKPAMSVVGSGSHGCVACLPIMTVAEKKGIEGEIVLRACVLSFLITIYLKKYTGRLSAFCGCAITAAIGAAVGIVFLLGGNLKQMVSCINNMVGDVTGLLCDGGNFSCSLKCATGVSSAVRSALLALERISVPIIVELLDRMWKTQ
jgi:L-cysteine desulfidase